METEIDPMMDGRLPIRALDPETIAYRLEQVRERTLSLIAGVDWSTLQRQHLPILSPMVWDLGHIANFEESWLCQRLGGSRPLRSGYERLFDAVLNPRSGRHRLPLPAADELWDYLTSVRSRSLKVLEQIEEAREPELLSAGFVYEMVAEHEEQHQETMLQLLQVFDQPPHQPAQTRSSPAGRQPETEMVLIPEGPFRMGWRSRGFGYDNESAAHQVSLPAFFIDVVPVSCGQFLQFVEDDGYERPELWSEEGWRWRQETGSEAPDNWFRSSGEWHARYMAETGPLRTDLPVVHVCYFEAEAFARWAGKRLPTEAEWEKAALWDPEADDSRPYPWGSQPPDPMRANLDQLVFRPAAIGAYPAGASAYGVEQLLGDVWEWTSSEFRAYPGFEAFPYPEYSQIFFGSDYKVLRGGSWATRPAVARGTFRNWDFPVRRQIFSGFRCARDVA